MFLFQKKYSLLIVVTNSSEVIGIVLMFLVYLSIYFLSPPKKALHLAVSGRLPIRKRVKL